MDQSDHAKTVSISAMKSTTKSLGNFNQTSSFNKLKMRKKSYGFGTGVAGVRLMERRTSQVGAEYKRPPLSVMNTYQLDPRVKFHVAKATKVANELLDSLFNDHIYNVQESPSTTLRIAGDIMRAIKKLGFNRYRIITVVTLGQKRAQSYNNAVSFLWDHQRDGLVNLQREVNTAFLQVTIFAIYLD